MLARRIKNIPTFERPREKLKSHGAENLSGVELVAILLGTGTKERGVMDVARLVHKEIEKNPQTVTLDVIQKISGVGLAKASLIVAAFELARRFLSSDNVAITTGADVAFVTKELRDKKQEYFMALTVNGAGHLIEKHVVSIGTLNESIVHPRDVFNRALVDHAAGVILVHNHPSGDLSPSAEDVNLTGRLSEAGTLLGIKIFDHVIVGRTGYFSFVENGLALHKDG